MELFEIIKKYGIINYNECSQFVLDEDATAKEFQTEYEHSTNQQFIKIYTTPGKFISIKKMHGVLSNEKDMMDFFLEYIKTYYIDGLLDYEVLLSQAKLFSILSYFLKKCHISTDYLPNYAQLISFLEDLAVETYESQKICFAIGFDANLPDSPQSINFLSIQEQKKLRVISNGIDTLIVCNSKINFISLERMINSTIDTKEFYPLSFANVAHWTAQPKRFALILTRCGEILIFYAGRLACMKRRKVWSVINLKSLLHFAMKPVKLSIRNAVMQTCMDVSFSRTGACIGILNENINIDRLNIVKKEDLLSSSQSSDSIKMLRAIVNNKKFHEIDRAIRKELAAMDGAIIIGYDGTIYTIGAILDNRYCKNRGNHGARTIAAQSLAYYGYGFKVSADGNITVWKKDGKDIKEVFTIM